MSDKSDLESMAAEPLSSFQEALSPSLDGREVSGFGARHGRKGEVVRLVSVCAGKVMATVTVKLAERPEGELIPELARLSVEAIGLRWLQPFATSAAAFQMFSVSYLPDVWARWDESRRSPARRIPLGLLPKVPGERAQRREDLENPFRLAVREAASVRIAGKV